MSQTPRPPHPVTAADLRWAVRLGCLLVVRRQLYWLAPEAESAAGLALAEAASSFDPDRGVKFRTYAGAAVRGRVVDFLRSEMPRGFKRNWRPGAAGRVAPGTVPLGRAEPFAPPDGGVAGVDYRDLVDGMALCLKSPSVRRVFRAYHRGAVSQVAVARSLGLSKTRVGQCLEEAYSTLRGWPAGRDSF